ncbi:pyrroline-5-carboxylate reductase [Ottowia testudinis]|uniref:Pyrroline-5-carboxylate reductase n=1 Tax=Ottowia testudinis TaxID=2816950 RepID=A0A975H427_9BURK|nr:pyrroline-5-carboxylate reductase [Ottowia testudinis]QTD45886.1 pyrroline-5-carboxylate reductase [Ottowia testudinis]
MTTPALPLHTRIAFIGGGNMASAIMGGLIRQGLPVSQIEVVEPFEATRSLLKSQHGALAHPAPGPFLTGIDLLVWAVKPQSFREAAAPVAPHLGNALQLSVMAGIRAADIQAASGSGRIVRCMPNTPALVGRGMTGMFATPGQAAGRPLAEAVIRTTGDVLWVEREEQLDAVTALSGSGPAYVFYFLEAMQQAGAELGLSPEQARRLAVGTFAGGAQLAADSPEPLATLRERVTSKGGTTHAALTAMEQAGIQQSFVKAMHAACTRAQELGDEFGR